MEPPDFLGLFNMPGGKLAQGRRDQSNVPAQALAMLNDPLVLQQASVWADNTRHTLRLEPRITVMFQQALGRSPLQEERAGLRLLVAEFADLHAVDEDDVMRNHAVWQDLAHTLFNMKEFIYIH
jgi:hypothetical protein